MILVYVPAGSFIMGDSAVHAQSECEQVATGCNTITFSDEAPAHKVNLNDYWIDQTEVSNAMYTACVQAGKCTSNGMGSDSTPAVYVTWEDASKYCAWAGRRLPTEAEWEMAARGTDGNIFPWGNSPASCSLANSAGCLGHADGVDSYSDVASPYGALNMAGNVWEWVADWFNAGYGSDASQTNPKGPPPTNLKVIRGGSWSNPDGYMILTGRGSFNPKSKFGTIGFRCAANP